MPHDASLVHAARQGDRSAFGTLYQELYPAVYRFAYFHTRSSAEAEDVAAEAFLRALNGIRGFRGAADQFQAWVFRIARNVIIDRARKNHDHQNGSLPNDLVAEDGVGSAEDRVVLQRALAILTVDQRSTLVLRFVIGLPTREVATILGKTEGAVEQLQLRGLAALAREMDGYVR